MPLVHYREPQRNDIVVFLKPVANTNGEHLILVKRLIGVPGDRLRLRDGIVFINGVAQDQPSAQPTTPENHTDFRDEFPFELKFGGQRRYRILVRERACERYIHQKWA